MIEDRAHSDSVQRMGRPEAGKGHEFTRAENRPPNLEKSSPRRSRAQTHAANPDRSLSQRSTRTHRRTASHKPIHRDISLAAFFAGRTGDRSRSKRNVRLGWTDEVFRAASFDLGIKFRFSQAKRVKVYLRRGCILKMYEEVLV